MIMDKSNSGMNQDHMQNGGSQPHTNLDELFSLLRNEIPEGRQTLLDTQSNLEKVADYCATAYLDTKDKKSAFEKTKNYTTHSLASVAYQVNTLAYNILHMLELQTNQISEMESQVNYISQKVDFHKEKVARREIALLTSAKTTARQPKVLIPANEEKQGKYIRKPIDFSILDDIGHGVKVVNNPSLFRTTSNSSGSGGGGGRMSGIQTLGPKSSMSSLSHYHHYNTLGGSGPAPTTKPPTPPQVVRSGFGTLTRSQNKEYRALAPPIAPPQVPKNYEANYPIGHPKNPMTQRQNSGNYSTLPMHPGNAQISGNHHHQQQQQYMPGMAAVNSHYGPGAGGGGGAISSVSLNSSTTSQYGPSSMMHHPNHQLSHSSIHNMSNSVVNTTTPPPPPPPQTGNLSSSSIGNDSLPEPPPHLQHHQPQQQPQQLQQQPPHPIQHNPHHSNYDSNRISTASPPLPPPPPPHGEDHELMHRPMLTNNNNANAIYGTRPNPNSVPHNYVEKVIAIYDYFADKDDELTFKENSVIFVTRKNDDGWYEGELNGVTGLFPGNYVEPCL